MPVQFLSDDWVAELRERLNQSETFRVTDGCSP